MRIVASTSRTSAPDNTPLPCSRPVQLRAGGSAVPLGPVVLQAVRPRGAERSGRVQPAVSDPIVRLQHAAVAGRRSSPRRARRSRAAVGRSAAGSSGSATARRTHRRYPHLRQCGQWRPTWNAAPPQRSRHAALCRAGDIWSRGHAARSRGVDPGAEEVRERFADVDPTRSSTSFRSATPRGSPPWIVGVGVLVGVQVVVVRRSITGRSTSDATGRPDGAGHHVVRRARFEGVVVRRLVRDDEQAMLLSRPITITDSATSSATSTIRRRPPAQWCRRSAQSPTASARRSTRWSGASSALRQDAARRACRSTRDGRRRRVGRWTQDVGELFAAYRHPIIGADGPLLRHRQALRRWDDELRSPRSCCANDRARRFLGAGVQVAAFRVVVDELIVVGRHPGAAAVSASGIHGQPQLANISGQARRLLVGAGLAPVRARGSGNVDDQPVRLSA